MSNLGNFFWISQPSTLYGAVTPIALGGGAFQNCKCYTHVQAAIEFSGNTPANTINLQLSWYDANKVLLFTETICSSTLAADNVANYLPIKGYAVKANITGSNNAAFTASVQIILQQY